MTGISHRRPPASVGVRSVTVTAALTAFAGTVALLLVISSAALPSLVVWSVSAVALAFALVVLVALERAWDTAVDDARTAGVVAD
jgi:hypothetical protein